MMQEDRNNDCQQNVTLSRSLTVLGVRRKCREQKYWRLVKTGIKWQFL